jgi:metal-responsive CopG/Arc/MetJ family transcriptional regulator
LQPEADLVEKLDEVRRSQGIRSRMDLFRKSLKVFLASVGEKDVAASLATVN